MDVIAYNCSILSGDQGLHLTWLVTYPGFSTLNITFTRTSSRNFVIRNNDMSFSSTLNTYVEGVNAESMITFDMERRDDVNGTTLECRFANASADDTIWLTNSVGMYGHSEFCVLPTTES